MALNDTSLKSFDISRSALKSSIRRIGFANTSQVVMLADIISFKRKIKTLNFIVSDMVNGLKCIGKKQGESEKHL